jgi:hypothetical protein
VNDGVVLATDSASTIMAQGPTGQTSVVNVYNNANKLFNLCKGQPVGAITWGSGSIGLSSIATLAKDFRKEMSGASGIDPSSYTIKDIAEKFKKFIYDDKYVEAFKDWSDKPALGFMIAGYSSGRSLAEEWDIQIEKGQCNGPRLIRAEDKVGITANGMPDAISRLYAGHGIGLPEILKMAGLDDPTIGKVMALCNQNLVTPLAIPPMPIQDVIDLAKFLVETTINFTKFSPGAPLVGGPIEIAAITKYEGFKWVQRKYYYNKNINQE